MNKKQKALLEEFMAKRADIKEELLWIGCNPNNPEMYKRQAEEGFKKMDELNKLACEYHKKIEDAETDPILDIKRKNGADGEKNEMS